MPVAFYPDPKDSQRRELIEAVEDGTISIETAAELAAQHELGALVGPADADILSAAREPYWSLLMVMGWIMSRDYDVVQNLYGPFVKGSTLWQQRPDAPPIVTKRTMPDLSDLAYAYRELGVGAFPPPTSFPDAWVQLRDTLAHSESIAAWIWSEENQAMEKAPLELIASLTAKATGPTESSALNANLRFLRQDILAQWPADSAQKSNPTRQRHYIRIFLKELDEDERVHLLGVLPAVERNDQIWKGAKAKFPGQLDELPPPSEKTFQRAIRELAAGGN